MTADLLHLSALDQARLVKAGAVSPVELHDLYAERIERFDPALHAFVQRHHLRGRSLARWAERAAKAATGSFHGVPSAIKDTEAFRYAPTQVGSRALRYLWTPFDSPAVAALRATGMVFLGKTATSELGILPVVETDLQPATVNPWNRAHTSGGSSGGAAAAVAAGMLPVAHAGDGGGSIRIPAALCNLYGFKSSRGTGAGMPARIDPLGMVRKGCVARHVEDAAAVADALCGHPAGGPFLEALRQPPPRGLRVRLCDSTPLGTVHPEISAAVHRVGRLLEALGHHVEPVDAIRGEVADFLPAYAFLSSRAPVLDERQLQPVSRWLRTMGRQVPQERAQALVDDLRDRLQAWMGDADLVLSPTTPVFAPKVGAFQHPDPEAHFLDAARLGWFTAPFNASGQPAASLPAGPGGPDGLPMGVQLVARHGQDALVLRVSQALEEELRWQRQVAPGFFPAG